MALTFYTRIPLPSFSEQSEAIQAHSIIHFPLVGWIVGSVSALVYIVCSWVLPPSVAILLSMIGSILLTGGLHEDGLADSCDGFGGGWTKEQILAIMKDSSAGVYAILGLGLILSLKFLLLIEMEPSWVPAVLISGHSISRFFAASLLYTCEYVGGGNRSKSQSFVKKLSGQEFILLAVLGGLPIIILLGWAYLLLLAPLWGIRWLLVRCFMIKIGGYTGDCLGATQQLTEVFFYLMILIVGLA